MQQQRVSKEDMKIEASVEVVQGLAPELFRVGTSRQKPDFAAREQLGIGPSVKGSERRGP